MIPDTDLTIRATSRGDRVEHMTITHKPTGIVVSDAANGRDFATLKRALLNTLRARITARRPNRSGLLRDVFAGR